MGVVGLYPDDKENPVRFELVSLKGSLFGEDPGMVEHMRTYQTRLFDEQIILAESPSTHPSGASFVGAEKCGECHTKAFAVWKDSAHAHAFESLNRITNAPASNDCMGWHGRSIRNVCPAM